MVVPTLAADEALEACLDALERQSTRDFRVIVVDNSGRGLVRPREGITIIANDHNLGFGAAINQGIQASESPYIATLNDDAIAEPQWIAALTRAINERPEIGMGASRILLAGPESGRRLDSAGMLICMDGSSKQAGHLDPPENFADRKHALLPSGCAAIYRREMLDEIGFFDESFFLYCEDTDLGLRARWAGWKCLYVPTAVVEHHYSHSAGAASPVKAYFVERNRLFLVAKNFPAGMLLAAPFATVARYFWHLRFLLGGSGSAARFRAEGNAGPKLLWYVLKAHAALFAHARRLWRQRREIQRRARITPAVFRHLIRSHSISVRRVAAH